MSSRAAPSPMLYPNNPGIEKLSDSCWAGLPAKAVTISSNTPHDQVSAAERGGTIRNVQELSLENQDQIEVLARDRF